MEWFGEGCDLFDDPNSGSRIRQLTSAAMISNNIYGESPVSSADGSRIMIGRCHDFCFDTIGSVFLIDLNRLHIVKVDEMRGVRAISTSSWNDLAYYWNLDDELVQFNMMTFEKQVVFKAKSQDEVIPHHCSISPDQRYMLAKRKRLTGPNSPTFQILRYDLKKGDVKVIFEDQEICNPHLQFNPVTGNEILVQNNRGIRMDANGDLEYANTKEGTTLFQIDKNGANKRFLPAGPPHTEDITGHECFIANTRKSLFSTHWNKDDFSFNGEYQNTNLFIAAPGDAKPTPYPCPEHRFNHVSVSKCGTYFVADSHGDKGFFENGRLKPAMLVIGNIVTGKYDVLVEDSMSYGGGNQCTHTHPYITADNKHVIFNANPAYGVSQVFAATIPQKFLAKLNVPKSGPVPKPEPMP
ncbi:MAG: hypothetical protein KAG97_09210, partial [Victivallales bacterium]|nr:hypothetical protein [Victivallales bacterium]